MLGPKSISLTCPTMPPQLQDPPPKTAFAEVRFVRRGALAERALNAEMDMSKGCGKWTVQTEIGRMEWLVRRDRWPVDRRR